MLALYTLILIIQDYPIASITDMEMPIFGVNHMSKNILLHGEGYKGIFKWTREMSFGQQWVVFQFQNYCLHREMFSD